LESQIARIERSNDQINAFTVLDLEGARRAARESERRWRSGNPLGPLDGVTFAVKDNQSVRGYPCRFGSLTTPDAPVDETSPAVARCLEAGAVFLGLTTMPEFGSDRLTVSPLSGITRNPWDFDKHSGGSSGGAAAVVAAGFCSFAIGTDAGGSIRIPSALTGVTGMKGTGGRIPSYPANIARELSCIGPIAHDVGDIALLMNVLSKPDVRDPLALPPDGVDYVDALNQDITGLRIGWSIDLGFAPLVHPEISRGIEAAVGQLADLGAKTAVAHPGYPNPVDTQLVLLKGIYQYALRSITAENQKLLGPALRGMLEGTPITLQQYLSAQDTCRALARLSSEFFREYDLLVTPTVAAPAFPTSRIFPEEHAHLNNPRSWTPFTGLFNVTQQPAITVPIGLTSGGLPIGMQIIGPRGQDATVLRAAHALQRRIGRIGHPSI
jgi:aspartyl-tRNA(Asn)/glutamyl-tRNA(Gln) amidotransferase subunit A